MLSRLSLARCVPTCSTSLLAPPRSSVQPNLSRNVSGLPPAIEPFFQYASDCYITQGIQGAMEGLHTVGLSWPAAFVSAALLIRVGTAPFHVYAEHLFAKRLHAQNFFTQGILKNLGEKYRVSVEPNKDGKLELKTDDARIKNAVNKALAEIPAHLGSHGLQSARIQNLKICTIPVWLFSSFALRNIINSDFHPSIAGALWVPDLLVPDPYCILPVAVGLFGFLNLYSQRKIYPGMMPVTWKQKSYDVVLGFFTFFAVTIMSQLPACIPLYWLVVSISGMTQAQALRHPTVKKLFGIKRLPTDSRTPFRDIFTIRKDL